MTKKSTVNHQKSSQTIEGTFDADYDILHLHQNVLEYLKNQEIEETQDKLEEIKSIEKLLEQPMTVLQQKYYANKLKQLAIDIEDIKNHKKINEYESKVANWIELFHLAGGGVKKVYFGKNHILSDEEKELIPYRLEIIRKFISIVKQYMNIYLIEHIPSSMLCPVCDLDLSGTSLDENGIQRCPQCNFERALPTKGFCSSTNATLELSGSRTKVDNEERENFMKARTRYTGRTKRKIST